MNYEVDLEPWLPVPSTTSVAVDLAGVVGTELFHDVDAAGYLSKEQLVALGRMGERLAYAELALRYPAGSVHWLNEDGECCGPYDIAIDGIVVSPTSELPSPTQEPQRLVEVKCTTRAQLDRLGHFRAQFSTSELETAMSAGERYCVFCVVVDTEQWKAECFPIVPHLWDRLRNKRARTIVQFPLSGSSPDGRVVPRLDAGVSVDGVDSTE